MSVRFEQFLRRGANEGPAVFVEDFDEAVDLVFLSIHLL